MCSHGLTTWLQNCKRWLCSCCTAQSERSKGSFDEGNDGSLKQDELVNGIAPVSKERRPSKLSLFSVSSRRGLLSCGACLPPLPRKPKIPRSVPRFFKNLGNRDSAFFPDEMPLDPIIDNRCKEDADLWESMNDLVLIAYHESGVNFRGMGLIVMKLAFYLRKSDAMSIMHSALENQAPRTGQLEPVLNENRFNLDVTKLLRQRRIMPVLRVVPESKMSSKEDKPFSPVPGFRSFVEDLKSKVIKYDPRAKPSEPDFYDPRWLQSIQEASAAGVNAVMELVPDDLQQGMILTFDIRDKAAHIVEDENDDVSVSEHAPEVLLHIDRTRMNARSSLPAKSAAPQKETLHLEGPNKRRFADLWKQIWLQDYTHHAAIGSTRGLATKGWMPMQLRGLRESFAQILTDTKMILFRERESCESFESCLDDTQQQKSSTKHNLWGMCLRRKSG